MKKILILITFLTTLSSLASNKELINEMEALRKTLKPGTETELELSRRLADLYFKDAVDINKENILKGIVDATPELKNYRQRALELYSASLKGTKTPKQKALIQFQIARVLESQEKKKEASEIYQKILERKDLSVEIRRETAIKLAEYFDDEYQDNKAKKYYLLAISLCNDIDVCGYANYKYAWVLYRNGEITKAVTALEKSLFTKQGEVQERSLADYIVFLSNMKTDGKKELIQIQALSNKIQRPEIVRKLGETFYTSGNRIAGTYIISYLNDKNPNTYYTVRLTEEYYGFKNWSAFRQKLDQLSKLTAADLPKEESKAKEVQAIVKRLSLQLDGEVSSDKKKKSDLQKVIDVYLTFFPNDELRTKMVDGWLNVEENNDAKIKKLTEYISFSKSQGDTEEEIRLRRIRLSLAQKTKNNEVILVDSKALSEKLEKTDEKRQFSYLYAQTLYKENEVDQALPLFVALANIAKEGVKADKWAVLSQNLALDILNQKKDYAGLMAQANTWISNDSIGKDKKIAKEIAEMKKVSTQAEFEKAFTLGQTTEALRVFEKFCYAGQFVKKSCSNVKVLAVKLQDQDSIIKILEHNKDDKALMAEYERMGRFSDAAKLQEKYELAKNKTLENYLRIALLYELDNNLKDRNRILDRMILRIKKTKKIDEKLEPLVFSTLVEAGYFNYKLVSLPWNISRKMRIVEELENRGMGSKQTRKMFLGAENNMGALWEANKVKPLVALNEKQAKQGFYGRYQQTRFKRRVAKLKTFADKAKKVLEVTTPVARVYVSNMVAEAYLKLAMEIENMPIPKIIEDQAQRDQMKQNLIVMAEPFKKESEGYRTIFTEQMSQITDLDTQDKISMNLDKPVNEYFQLFKKSDYKEYQKEIPSIDEGEVAANLKLLKTEPDNKSALNNLVSYYETNNHQRLAAYYKGRVLSLSEGENQ